MPFLGKIIARLAFVYIAKIIFSCNRKSDFLLTIALIFCNMTASLVKTN